MARARRSNIDEHRACQADPLVFGLFWGEVDPDQKPVALQGDLTSRATGNRHRN
jgi:hypothetical protein